MTSKSVVFGSIVVFLGLWTTVASAAPPLAVDMESAADHHVAAQGRYQGGLANSWEYDFGSGKSGTNITGVVAHGLLAAHRLTGLQEHEDSALKAARSLIRAYDKGWNKRRPHTQDIEFLVAAGFIIDAARWFKLTTARYSPETYVNMVTSRRVKSGAPAVAGWDLASAIRAAVAVGELSYAKNLLAATLAQRSRWDREGRHGGQSLAHGSLLWALADVRDRAGLTPEQERFAAGLVRELVASQQKSGGWLDRAGGLLDTQTAAYAVLGLTRWSGGAKAAATGRRWLRQVSLTDGRFFMGGKMWATTYTPTGKAGKNFNSEIQSEAMLALASGN